MRTNAETVINSLEYLVSGAGDGYFKANPDVRRLISQDEAWVGAQRGIITQGIGNCLFEACDVAGLERIALPAEFMAAGIVLMVREVNWLLACHWVGGMHSTSVMMSAEEASFDAVLLQQLFAMVLTCGEKFRQGTFEERWKARFDSRLENVKGKK
jgi:hypothetical protein